MKQTAQKAQNDVPVQQTAPQQNAPNPQTIEQTPQQATPQQPAPQTAEQTPPTPQQQEPQPAPQQAPTPQQQEPQPAPQQAEPQQTPTPQQPEPQTTEQTPSSTPTPEDQQPKPSTENPVSEVAQPTSDAGQHAHEHTSDEQETSQEGRGAADVGAALRSTAREDETDERSDLQKKYGFDVSYDPKSKRFMLHQNKNRDMLLTDQDIDANEWNDDHLEDMTDIFSEKSTIKYENVDLYTAIHEGKSLVYASYLGDNIVTVYNYQMDEEDREDCVQMLMEKYQLDEEEAKSNIETLIHGKDNLISFLSYKEHEEYHLYNHKNSGSLQYDLPPEYMAKLDMMDEISANMSQAGLALDMYKATGDVKYFDDLLAIDTEDLKKALQENPDMQDKEAFVAKYVNDQWLKQHNTEQYNEKTGQMEVRTIYGQQAYNLSTPHLWNYPIWAMAENPNTINQYHERCDAMFENIMGLGDVRQYVTPDFELNNTLKQQLAKDCLIDSETLKKIMVQDAQNAEQYSANVTAFFNKIKEIDADGFENRTAEENAQIEEYIQQCVQKYDIAHAETKPQENGHSMAATAAMRQRNQGR